MTTTREDLTSATRVETGGPGTGAVADSGSTDATAAVASAAGARVEHSHAVLPRLGTVPGKGEALWKALHLLRSAADQVGGRRTGRRRQTLVRRLPATPTTADGEPVSAAPTQFVRDRRGRFGMRTFHVSTERPPMLTVPEYRARHGLAPSGT